MHLKLTYILSIILIFVLYSPHNNGQVNILWNKFFGGSGNDVGRSVRQTSDGGYIIVGYTESYGAGGYDVWLIRTDESGDTLWTRTFGGSSDDYGYSVEQTKDEGYVLVGITNSFASGGSDVWLIKTNSTGNTTWTKTFGGIGDDGGYSVQQTADGGFIVSGYTTLTRSQSDRWLIKTNAFGDTLWTKVFVGNGTFFGDYGNSVEQTTDGGYIMGGTINGGSYPFTSPSLIKTDSLGKKLWSKDFEPGSFFASGEAVHQTVDSGFILVGGNFGYGIYELILIKTDSSGNLVWKKSINDSYGCAVQQTRDEGYIITGYFGITTSSLLLVRTNSAGGILWTKTYYYGCGYSVQQTSDDGYVGSGLRGSTSEDVSFLKTTTDIVDVEPGSGSIPSDISMSQNYPNPFNPTTSIRYQIPEIGLVTIKVYDILGSEVATLVNEEKPAGTYEVQFNSHSVEGRNLMSGIYFYQLKAGDYSETKKMILLR
jgi:predicted secreted protein